jgi:hypothetical protein
MFKKRPDDYINYGRRFNKFYNSIKYGGVNPTSLNILNNLLYSVYTEFSKLDSEVKQEILEFFQLNEDAQLEQQFKQMINELNSIHSDSKGNSIIFEGKRLGLETISAVPAEGQLEKLPGIELANYNFLRDPEFFSYGNWKDILMQDINENVNLIGGSNFTRSFSAWTSSYLPKGEGFANFARTGSMSMNWELYAYSKFQTVREKFLTGF